ncbi:MAG: major capsid protein [Microviridae sp.]|nr:MAG: major capsid protein [Microviridae sp.]
MQSSNLLIDQKVRTQPAIYSKSVRRNHRRIMTSMNAGKMMPLSCIPLLREDAVRRSRFNFEFVMAETAESLMNGVRVDLRAYFVSNLAFERFKGMDDLNAAYSHTDVINYPLFVDIHKFGGGVQQDEIRPFYQAIGAHAKFSDNVNTAYLEAYNHVFNHRCKQVSSKIQLRDRLDDTIAPAFWYHTNLRHVVPDFDDASIEGEISLSIVDAKMPVKGIGVNTNYPASSSEAISLMQSDGTAFRGDGFLSTTSGGNDALIGVSQKIANTHVPDIYAEMKAEGVVVSLANIELAKKTRAFAEIRRQYQGVDEEHIIDLLMSGINVPEQALKQPILLDKSSTVFGHNTRYATDAGNLEQSVTDGKAYLGLNLRLPPVNTGGVIVITAEVTPEQMYERIQDPYFHTLVSTDFPNAQNDALDPQKVTVVNNEYVDTDHNQPDAVFGYAPLNHQWDRNDAMLGGKFYKNDADAPFDENRQRIWTNEVVDPQLTEDFYLTSDLHQRVFASSISDTFEVSGLAEMFIEGNTQFGPALVEATNDYQEIIADVDTSRIGDPAPDR